MAERHPASSASCGDEVAHISNPKLSNMDLYNDNMFSLSSTQSNFLCWGRLAEGGANGDREIGPKSVEGVRPTFNDSEWTVDEPLRIKIPTVPTKTFCEAGNKNRRFLGLRQSGKCCRYGVEGSEKCAGFPVNTGWSSFSSTKQRSLHAFST